MAIVKLYKSQILGVARGWRQMTIYLGHILKKIVSVL